jgi:hypothetical protein
MFYLKHFWEVTKNANLNGILFIILSILAITSVHHRSYFQNIFSMSQKIISRPYLNALISDKVDLQSISRKISNLPGVEKVSVKRTSDLGAEIANLEKEIGTGLVQSLGDLNFASINIELTSGISERSQALVREYLSRLAGKNTVAISNIKKPKAVTLSKNDPYQFVNNWGDWYIIAIILVLWLVSFVILTRSLRNYSYLIERFQRRKHVAFKIFITGFGTIVSAAFLLNMYFRPSFNIESLFLLVGWSLLAWGIYLKRPEFKKIA